ncbi:MAG: DciA family protein [Pseudomonadota bacterium]
MNSHRDIKSAVLGQEVQTKAAMPTSARSIGVEVEKLLRPLHGKGKARGKRFVPPELLSAWPEIVGPRLAGVCLPVNLKQQPKRSGSAARRRVGGTDGALLEVLCAAEVMVDVDYGQAVLVERINAFFGYRAVSRLKVVMKQAVAETSGRSSRVPSQENAEPVLDPQAEQRLRTASGDVEDPALRDALCELGAAIIAETRKAR